MTTPPISATDPAQKTESVASSTSIPPTPLISIDPNASPSDAATNGLIQEVNQDVAETDQSVIDQPVPEVIAEMPPATAVPMSPGPSEAVSPLPEVTPSPPIDAPNLPAPELASSGEAPTPAPSATPTPLSSGPQTDQAAADAVSAMPTPSSTTSTTPKAGLQTTLLDILIRDQEITQSHADQIVVEQIQTGKTIDEIIEAKQIVSEEALSRARAEIFGVPFVKISEIGISPEALTVLSQSVAQRYGMLPFSIDKDTRSLSVVMKNPLDLTAIDFAEQKTGYTLDIHYAMPSELERLIAERYAQSLSSEVTQALEETTQVAQQRAQKQNLGDLSGEVVRQAPITKIVETVLAFAMKARASDVHIEPLLDRTRVRYRIDGILTEKLILPSSVHDATVSRIKILSDLKIDEKRVPQDGRFNFVAGGEEVDLRVSTLPTIHGEKIVMRLLKKNAEVPSLEQLGLNGPALRDIKEAIRVPHGIILVTGPTGSGKTTTLYSVLHTINTPKVNIMTLEDPVEYQMAGVNQVQINPQAGLTFASGLRSFLRQDPNIIMVGEIRDSETVELAVQASLTGHLVFSTLHTSSAAGALPRLLDMGAEPFLLASSMTLTMGQRVVRKINTEFKEEYKPEPAVLEDIKKVLGDRFTAWCKENNKDPDNIVLYRAKADRPQTEPEYKGRVAVFEVMRITEEIGNLILNRKSAAEIEKVAMKNGMLLMKQDGYLKALEGVTTIEEVLRVAQV